MRPRCGGSKRQIAFAGAAAPVLQLRQARNRIAAAPYIDRAAAFKISAVGGGGIVARGGDLSPATASNHRMASRQQLASAAPS